MVKTSEYKPISFEISKDERAIVHKIVDRALKLAKKHRVEYERSDCMMDVIATHANGNPLRLADLLAAPDFDFAHDIFGIRRHLNRRNAQLEDFFSPRFSAPSFTKPLKSQVALA